ncbi:MAG: lipopolysaccharide biosynthesis protein [bacterium]|nr:lipopolysaccharide biosynthesis protein [bacterium]
MTHRAFSGALWTASGWGLSAVFQLAFGIVIARILGPETLGIYAAALVVIRFSNLFANIGIGPALVQRENLETRHIRTGLAITLGLSLLVAGATWLGAPFLAGFYRMPEVKDAIRTLALVFPLRGLAAMPQALLQRDLEFRRLAAIEASAYLLGFGVVAVALGLAGFGLHALILATVTHAALELALLSWVRPFPLIPLPSWSSARELLSFGGGITLAGIFGFLAFQGDKLLVGRLLGAGALGLYSRAYSLVATSTRLYQKIATTAFFPLLSRLQDDRVRLGRGFRRGLALNAISVLPSSVVLYVVAPELIEALLGQEWLGAIAPFRILVLFFFLRTTAKLCGPVVMAAGKVYELALIQGVFAILVVCGAWLGSRWGIGGVAGGVAIAIVGHSVLLLHTSLRLTGVAWSEVFGAWFRPAVLALLFGAQSWLLIEVAGSWFTSPATIVAATLLPLAITLTVAFLIAPRLLLGDDTLEALRQLRFFRVLEDKVLHRFHRTAS